MNTSLTIKTQMVHVIPPVSPITAAVSDSLPVQRSSEACPGGLATWPVSGWYLPTGRESPLATDGPDITGNVIFTRMCYLEKLITFLESKYLLSHLE